MDQLRRLETAHPSLAGLVALDGPLVVGHALDPARLDLGLVVELVCDGLPFAVMRADLFDRGLAQQGLDNPFHGFAFRLPQSVQDAASMIEVRLANEGPLVGAPLDLRSGPRETPPPASLGSVTWLGGLRFGGWTAVPQVGEASLRGLIDEDQVIETRSSGWTTVETRGGDLAVPTFEFHLPQRFADGRAHAVEVVTASGEVLPPGPVSFVAFDDGLRRFLSERPEVASEQVRGALFDRLIPQSLPFVALEDWRRRFPPPTPAADTAMSIAIALFGETDLEASLDSLQDQAVNWIAGVVPLRSGSATFAPADLLAFLEGDGAPCAIVVFASSGSLFLDHALAVLAAGLQTHGGCCVYADTIVASRDGHRVPLGLPVFDRERCIEQGYAAGFFALTREAAMAAARGGADSLFRLFNSTLDRPGPAGVPLHVPGFLAVVPTPDDAVAQAALMLAARHHCEATGVEAEVMSSGRSAIRLRRRITPLTVSVVIPVRNDADRLRRCLDALETQRSVHKLDLVLVDNETSDPDCLALLRDLARDGATVAGLDGAGTPARLFNRGAAAGHGDLLCCLDGRIALATSDAIDEMASRLADPTVAAVGGLIAWPNGIVREAGLVANFHDGTGPALADHMMSAPGYAGLLDTAREVTALSGDLLMVRRAQFLAAGGLDTVIFPRCFPFVSFCLRMRDAGHLVVLTPHAKATWNGSASAALRNADAGADRELAALRDRWPALLVNDPFYSPLLALNGLSHSALAWPPRDTRPRRPPGAAPAPPTPFSIDES